MHAYKPLQEYYCLVFLSWTLDNIINYALWTPANCKVFTMHVHATCYMLTHLGV